MQNRNPISAPQCIVDPAGDLNLLVAQKKNQRSIRVSSKVLSLASPVFATMFGPRYLEGYVLSKQAKFSIPSFPLPEEDPEAMTWFCRAVHLQLSANERGMTVDLSVKIAALCDKYDASTALSGWSQPWSQNLSHPMLRDSTIPPRHPAKALHMSYAFNNHRAFYLATRDIMHHCSREDIPFLKDESKDLVLPNQLIDSIETERRTTYLAFERAIERVISDTCPVLTVTVQYLHELSRLGLWPNLDLEVPDSESFSQLKKKIPEIEPCDMSTSSTWEKGCSIAYIDVKGALHTASEEIFRNRKGLCLRCVNEGRVMVNDGNCRAKSHDSCKRKKLTADKPLLGVNR